jgi:hypothetical protein
MLLVSRAGINDQAASMLETHSQGDDGGQPENAIVAKTRVKIGE